MKSFKKGQKRKSKICTFCKKRKLLKYFYVNHSICKKCKSAWMSNHRQSNLEDYSNRNKEKFLNKKKHFITMYGGVCECCGESTFEFLSIEHKLGQKGMKKDSSMTAYKKATDKFSPEIYGILCHNCNQATKYGKLCPHKIV